MMDEEEEGRTGWSEKKSGRGGGMREEGEEKEGMRRLLTRVKKQGTTKQAGEGEREKRQEEDTERFGRFIIPARFLPQP